MMIIDVIKKCCCNLFCAPICAENVIEMHVVCRNICARMYALCTHFCTCFCTENARRKRDRNAQSIPVCISFFARHSARVLPQLKTITNN